MKNLCLLSVLMLLLIGCTKQATMTEVEQPLTALVIEDENVQEMTTQKDVFSEELVKIIETNQGVELAFGGNASGKSIAATTKWIDENRLFFAYEHIDESGQVLNSYFAYDVSDHRLDQLFETTSEANGGYATGLYCEDSKVLICYTEFETIQRITSEGDVKTICEEVNWIMPSPDQKHIIVSMRDPETVESYKRVIYDVIQNESKDSTALYGTDYLFANLSAGWSPDSKHLFTMPKIWGDTIDVVDGVTGKRIRHIVAENATISDPGWSTNGRYLKFMVQSEENRKLTFGGPHVDSPLSDIIGVYDVVDDKVVYKKLGGDLAFSYVRWEAGRQHLFYQTTSRLNGIKLINDVDLSTEIPVSVSLWDVEASTSAVILEGAVMRAREYYGSVLDPVFILPENRLIYISYADQGTFSLYAYDWILKVNTLLYKTDGMLQLKKVGKGFLVCTQEGLYTIDQAGQMQLFQNLKLTEFWSDNMLSPQQTRFCLLDTNDGKQVLKIFDSPNK